MATLALAIARAHGDKDITINQIVPPWNKGGISDDDARQLSYDRLMEKVRAKEAAASKAMLKRQQTVKVFLRGVFKMIGM